MEYTKDIYNHLTITTRDYKNLATLVSKYTKLKKCQSLNGMLALHLDFEKIIPVPNALINKSIMFQCATEINATHKTNIEKYGYPSWHQFCRENWGTPWNAYDGTMICHKKGKLVLQYYTAHTPAIAIIKKLILEFPTLKFLLNYEDDTLCSKGGIESESGIVITEWQDDISNLVEIL